MPRGLLNWTFTDVEKFLRKHHFCLAHVKGSHYFYIGSKSCIVQVPFHGSKPLKPRTLKSIIKQSGIDKNLWLAPKK